MVQQAHQRRRQVRHIREESAHMNIDPRQNDPQFQNPLSEDHEQASQFGMRSQADSPLQAGEPAAMSTPRGPTGLGVSLGADVYSRDGKKLGTVRDVYDDSVLVQKGIFFVHDYFIPYSHIATANADRVELDLPSDEAKNQDWSQRPSTAMLGQEAQAQSIASADIDQPSTPDMTPRANQPWSGDEPGMGSLRMHGEDVVDRGDLSDRAEATLKPDDWDLDQENVLNP
jgi:hypothetical protein